MLSTSPEKARLRDSVSLGWASANNGTAATIAADTRSKPSQRSRSTRIRYSPLKCHWNQRSVIPPVASLRHASITSSGTASAAACIAARNPDSHQLRPRSCWRTASAEKASSPSTPQPKVCAKNTMKLIGTNNAARSRVAPSRPILSHSPNATSASASDSE